MLKTIRKFFKFAASRAGLLKRGLAAAIVSAIFEAIQILALAVVLKAIIEQNVTGRTAWIALGIMLVHIIGVIIAGHISRMTEMEGSLLMCADHRISIGERMKYMPMGFFNKNSLGQITSAVTLPWKTSRI